MSFTVDLPGQPITIVFRGPPAAEHTPDVDLDDPTVPHEQVEAAYHAQRAQADVQVVFKFRTRVLPGATYEALLDAHPNPDAPGEWHPVEFPRALIEESIIGWTITQGDQVQTFDRQPHWSEVVELWEQWPQWARRTLFADLKAQNELGVSLGKARSVGNATPAEGPPIDKS